MTVECQIEYKWIMKCGANFMMNRIVLIRDDPQHDDPA